MNKVTKGGSLQTAALGLFSHYLHPQVRTFPTHGIAGSGRAHRARLVQVHDGGAAHEGDGDAQPALHAAAELADALGAHPMQIDRPQAPGHRLLQLWILRGSIWM